MTTGMLTTNAGNAAIIADLAGGANLVLTHVGFGDANGVPYPPNPLQVALVNERYRATINSVSVVPGALVVECQIPADTNDALARPSYGFLVAEAGLFAADGTLIGVARMNNGLKPPPTSGQASAATFQFKLACQNPSAITVVIDPVAQIHLGRHVRPFWMTVDGLLNDPPALPAVGATYVIGAAPTGAWAGFAGRLAQWVGVWVLSPVPEGHVVSDNSKALGHAERWLRREAGGWTSAEASLTALGVIGLATEAEVLAGINDKRAVTPFTLAKLPSFKPPTRFLVYTSSAVYTPSPGTKSIRFMLQAGGASGTVGDGSAFGRGGGSGALVEGVLSRSEFGASISITVGQGGPALPVGSTYRNGFAGGDTSLAVNAGLIIARGAPASFHNQINSGGITAIPASLTGRFFLMNGLPNYGDTWIGGLFTRYGYNGAGGNGSTNNAAAGGNGLVILEEFD